MTVVVDGRPLLAYLPAYLDAGRVYAPVDPLLLRVADRVWREGDVLVVERDSRRIRIPLGAMQPGDVRLEYVAVGPALRALGDRVRYDPAAHRLLVETAAAASIGTPSPFVPGGGAPPRQVFTPQPVATPRPVWTGPALPRRTPLPAPPPGRP